MLRCVAITCIITIHSLSTFIGWPPKYVINCPIPEIGVFVCTNLHILGLGLFTFIAGYVLAFQYKKTESYGRFLKKKAQRILVPLLFFAIIYQVGFSDFTIENFPNCVNGSHLWYLPMLFGLTLLVAVSIFKSISSVVLATTYFAIIHYTGCLRTLSETITYLPAFLCGFLINKYHLERSAKAYRKVLLLIAVLFCIFTFRYAYFLERLNILTFNFLSGFTIRCVVYALTAYIVIISLNIKKSSPILENLAANSFSIYLLHQFVINILLANIPFVNIGFAPSFIILFICAIFIPWFCAYVYELPYFDRLKGNSIGVCKRFISKPLEIFKI